MEKTLVSQLINGSHNIDRMKKEIHEIVSMLIGYTKFHHSFDFSIDHRLKFFENENGVWKLLFYNLEYATRDNHKIHVEFLIKDSYGHRAGYSSNNSSFLNAENTQIVYENLQTLVDGIFQEFPKVAEVFEPIIKASEMKF